MRERRDGIAAADRCVPALLGWTRQSSADRLRRTTCCECGRTTRGTASPHRAVLYPAEGVFRRYALGRARSTLHSEMVGVRELPQATRPDTVWACLLHPYNRACDAWCRDRACGPRRPHHRGRAVAGSGSITAAVVQSDDTG